MRLTRSDKDAFIRAVMDDVPQIDYSEKAAGVARNAIRESLPAIVAEAVAKHPDCFDDFTVRLPNGLYSISVKAATGDNKHDVLKHMPDVWNELVGLAVRDKEQSDARATLRSKVSAMIEGCTTLKQALERLPEFAKYLPKDRDGTGVSNLPAVANVVTDLMAAGWPK